MIKKFEIENYKALDSLNFTLDKENVIFIYGENGSGKSAIISALYFLLRSMRTLTGEDVIPGLPSRREGIYPELSSEELNLRIKMGNRDLAELLRNRRTIGKEGLMKLSLSFDIDGKEGNYFISFDKGGVYEEKLSYQIGQRAGTLFHVTRDNIKLSPTAFDERSYRGELMELYSRYFGTHSFIAILFSAWKRTNRKSFESKISLYLLEVLEFFDNIAVLSSDGEFAPKQFGGSNIYDGYVDRLPSSGVDRLGNMLNVFFTSLFRDIKRVYYKTSDIGGRMKYELNFVRRIGSEDVEVPYFMESKGIKKLVKIFPYIMNALSGGISIVDDGGMGIHDLILLELSNTLINSAKGQYVGALHNTLLMKELPSKSVYILSRDSSGNAILQSVNDYSFRTQKNNNVQNKYLQGDYEGIPLIGKLDLASLASKNE